MVAAIVVFAVVNAKKVVPGAAVQPNAVPSLPPPIAVGARAPGFSLQTRSGAITSASFAGKPYLLEIFATWCPHCQRETTVLRAIRAKYPDSKLGMLSVTGSPFGAQTTLTTVVPESQADVNVFESRYHLTWPSVYDSTLSVAKTWGFDGFPQIFIVDKHGKIAHASAGEISAAQLEAAIAPVL